jgi:GxxExxY protein
MEETPIDVYYRGVVAGRFRLDLVVNKRVVIEIKSASTLGPTDKRQLLNYLRATRLEVGLLLHFGPEPKFYRFVDYRAY